MANITRIKAHDPAKPKEGQDAPKPAEKSESKPTNKKSDKKLSKRAERKALKAEKKAEKREGKKPFILIRPFVAFGRYLRDSWRELRQVRWPNRKVTWKMVLAVFIYTALVISLLVVLDILFEWVFSLILK